MRPPVLQEMRFLWYTIKKILEKDFETHEATDFVLYFCGLHGVHGRLFQQ